MNSRSTRCHKYMTHAFTLIEVLVVVAIIALLIAILLPSLNAARQQSLNVICNSNLKQQVTALTLYAANYCDALPVVKNFIWEGTLTTAEGGYPELETAPFIQDAMIRYAGGRLGTGSVTQNGAVPFSKIFRCPAVERVTRVDWLAASDQSHYRYNTHKAIVHSTGKGRMLSAVRSSSAAVVMYDVAFADWRANEFPHQGAQPTINAAYMDGHSNPVAFKEYMRTSPKADFKNEAHNYFVVNGWDKELGAVKE